LQKSAPALNNRKVLKFIDNYESNLKGADAYGRILSHACQTGYNAHGEMQDSWDDLASFLLQQPSRLYEGQRSELHHLPQHSHAGNRMRMCAQHSFCIGGERASEFKRVVAARRTKRKSTASKKKTMHAKKKRKARA
jgi:hypothetical protein